MNTSEPAITTERPRLLETTVYTVQCYRCLNSFDALETVWCNCLASERTVLCPKCLRCFCEAPPRYKDAFWSAAPQALWDKKNQEHGEDGPALTNPEPEKTTRPLVLIVEENRQIQRTASRLISKLGFGTIVANDGEEGLDLARKYTPDIILTAALMPKLDGRQMCRLLKGLPQMSKTKMIVMTELYTQAKYRAEAFRRFKVDEYVAKPLSFEHLRMLMERFAPLPSA